MIESATRDDLIWLAGFLEGEGTFDARAGSPRVRVEGTDRDTIGRCATLFGSSIRLTLSSGTRKPTWHAEKSGAAAAEVMRAVLPFMGARRSGKIAGILAQYAARQAGNDVRIRFDGNMTRPPGILRPERLAVSSL